jgi:RNA polymerase subunit RPABC4/transcription elongation factor Spt4
MFLIAGVGPKSKILDHNPRLCPVCGLARAHYKRVDHYFSLFFIPLIRVKKGEPFIMCDKCEATVNEFNAEHGSIPGKQIISCKNCGGRLNTDFKYCPYCGKGI